MSFLKIHTSLLLIRDDHLPLIIIYSHIEINPQQHNANFRRTCSMPLITLQHDPEASVRLLYIIMTCLSNYLHLKQHQIS